MQGLTINQLYEECRKEIEAGNGERHIMISGDDEGNSYHELFFAFTPTKEFDFKDAFMECTLPCGVSADQAENEYIVLG